MTKRVQEQGLLGSSIDELASYMCVCGCTYVFVYVYIEMNESLLH